MPTDDQNTNTQMTPNAGMTPGSAINANMPADPASVADTQAGTTDASMGGMGTAPVVNTPVEPVAQAPVTTEVPTTTAPAPMDTTATAVPGAMPAADENGNQPAQ